jgi:hypothetical protein
VTATGSTTVIASTKMKYKGEEVAISLYCPELAFPDSDQQSCRFEVVGGGIDYSGRSIGFDSMQSLILSLMKIGTYLEKNEDVDAALIEWEGGSLDFPTFKNL